MLRLDSSEIKEIIVNHNQRSLDPCLLAFFTSMYQECVLYKYYWSIVASKTLSLIPWAEIWICHPGRFGFKPVNGGGVSASGESTQPAAPAVLMPASCSSFLFIPLHAVLNQRLQDQDEADNKLVVKHMIFSTLTYVYYPPCSRPGTSRCHLKCHVSTYSPVPRVTYSVIPLRL